MKHLSVIVLNFRSPALTIDCLKSLEREVGDHPDRCAICVDNASGDDSVRQLKHAMEENGWDRWLTLVESPMNLGFAGGNNLGIRAAPAANYLLLNSDARLQEGAIAVLLSAFEIEPKIGAVGPRLESPDGEAQVSCFRNRTPLTEMLEAAGTGPLDRMFSRSLVPMGVFREPVEAAWLSFACIMIRHEVIEQVGLLDDGYFMYFEDIDFSRRMRRAGWRLMHEPRARAVHLRGGSSPVKSAIKARARVPKYYYESRSRYFAKFYGGRLGLCLANGCWLLGRSIAMAREIVERRQRAACEGEARDNWTNVFSPLRSPTPSRGGDA